MPKYLGSKIEGVLFTHFNVDPCTGDVTEAFGWTNSGIENLREALVAGLHVAIKWADKDRMEANTMAYNSRKFKWRKRTKADEVQTAACEASAKIYATRKRELELLIVRVANAIDLPEKDRSQLTTYSKVPDGTLEEVCRYLEVQILNRTAEYEVSPILIRWQDKENKFYHVEDDFSISEWRLATMSYSNEEDGSIILTHSLYRAPHYEEVGGRIQLIDEGEGIWTETDGYFAKRSDAVKHAEEKIGEERQRLSDAFAELATIAVV